MMVVMVVMVVMAFVFVVDHGLICASATILCAAEKELRHKTGKSNDHNPDAHDTDLSPKNYRQLVRQVKTEIDIIPDIAMRYKRHAKTYDSRLHTDCMTSEFAEVIRSRKVL